MLLELGLGCRRFAIQRVDQSFLFLGYGNHENNVLEGSLPVLNHNERKIFDAFENIRAPMADAKIAAFCSQTSVYHPRMDVTKVELVNRTNWRRQEKTENVGEWKAKVCEVHNIGFNFRSRKVTNLENEVARSEQILPLELDEDSKGGFLVVENPSFGGDFSDKRRNSSFIGEDVRRRNSSFVRSERECGLP
ncbi:hypothetical protein Ancab_026316 [Ancistrocladus abbreviatus]